MSISQQAVQQLVMKLQGLPMERFSEVVEFVDFLAMRPSKSLKRQAGCWEGKVWIADDFDAPLPDELVDGFYGDIA